MSRDIIREITFFLHSILIGIIITFVYDWFLILRKLMKHGIVWISIEDFIFWTGCGIGVFYMLYRENNGILRWFAVLGAMIGMICYKLLISKRFVHIMSTCIYKIMCLLFRVIQIVLKPLKWLICKAKRFCVYLKKKMKKWQNFIKKKLTVYLKMLKMVLCKH